MNPVHAASASCAPRWCSGYGRGESRGKASRLGPLLLALAVFLSGGIAAADEGKAEAHVARAETALDREDYRKAVEEYAKAAEASEDIEIAKLATRTAHTYGFNKEALRAAERWLKLDKDDDEALLYVAQLQLRLGDLRDSRRSFLKLLERGEEPVDERLVALIPFLSEEDPDRANWLMQRLAKPYRDSAAAHYAAGVMALQAGEAEDAKKHAESAIELQEEWLQPHLLYARALLIGGEQEAAIDYTARMIGDNPDPDPEARLELAIMYLSAGRDDDALSQVNQVLLEQPTRSDALRLMAIINYRQGHLDAAWSDFQDLLSSGRYAMDALYYLARIADQRNELDQALALYSQVITGPNTVASQRRASGILSQQGKTDKALDHLREFADTHPVYAIDMLESRAQLLATAERYNEALDLYDRVLEYRPDNESTVLGKAEVLLRKGDEKDAISLYREAVRRWPESAATLNALGYTLADRTERYDEAEKLIAKALALEPDSPAIIDSWGWVLYRQGQHEEALAELQRAYEGLKDPEVAAHIVEVLWKLERPDEARDVLEEAEALFPDNALLEDVRERVFPDPD